MLMMEQPEPLSHNMNAGKIKMMSPQTYAAMIPVLRDVSCRYWTIVYIADHIMKTGSTQYLKELFSHLSASPLIPIVPILQELISRHRTFPETITFLESESFVFRDIRAFIPELLQYRYNAHRLIFAAISLPQWITLEIATIITIPIGTIAIAPGLPVAFRMYIAEYPNFFNEPLIRSLWSPKHLAIPNDHAIITLELALALPPREQIILCHDNNCSRVMISSAGLLTLLAELQGLYTFL